MFSNRVAERGGELRSLTTILAKVAGGGGGELVAVSGAGGTGKSTLLQEFGKLIPSETDFLSATCSLDEQPMQFGVVAQLLQSSPADTRSGRWGSVLEVMSEIDQTDDRDGVDNAAIIRVGSALAEVMRQRTVVISIDDSCFGDHSSLRILSYLLRRMSMLRVLIVVTNPLASSLLQSPFQSDLMRHPDVFRIRLGPLTPRGVAQSISGYVGDRRSRAISDDAYAVTGGNPLLVRALAEELCRHIEGEDEVSAARAGDISRLAAGGLLGGAVLACLHGGDDHVKVTYGLAVLGEDATPERVARLTGVPTHVADEIIQRLTESGLVVNARFRSPLLSGSVVEQMSAEERRHFHQGVAWLLYDEGQPPIKIARHLVAAGTAVEPWAFQVLRDAAIQAAQADEMEFALETLHLAGTVCTAEPDRTAIRLTRVAVASWQDPAATVRWLDPLVAAFKDGHLPGADAVQLIHNLTWHGRLEDAAASLDLLATTLDPGDSRTAAAVRPFRSWLEFVSPALVDPEVSRRLFESRSGSSLVLLDRHSTATELLLAVLRGGAQEQTIAIAEEIIEGCSFDAEFMGPSCFALLALVYAGRLDIALRRCDSLLDMIAARRAFSWEAFLLGIRALIADHQGDPIAAERNAREALDRISRNGWGIGIGTVLAVLVSANTAMGKTGEAARWLSHPVPETLFQTFYGLKYLHARGDYHLAVGRPDAALADFVACGDLMVRWGIDLPACVPWRASAAQACLALGDASRARGYLDEQNCRPGADVPWVRAVSLRVAATTRPLRDRPALLQEALVQLSGAEHKVETIRVLIDLSQVFRELGMSGRARSTVWKAWKAAQASGLEALCSRQLPSDLTAHLHVVEEVEADDVVALTDSEMAVARLAALEHTNREIGRKMSITVSTVEQHLTRVYRKLGVNGRKEIGLVLRMYPADSA
ncbi:AAA family ATPase [Nocardia sp. NPDC060259]|uniref:helix-turn-helix transcriptional regulator n=1 Tax=Nocardia sp. NPDC060259 TaxID=3347088 RepID=UPI0036545ADF